MNPEQLKAALRSAGYLVASEGGGGFGTEPGDPFIPGPTTYYYYGPRGRVSATEAAAAIGIPESTLTSMESRLVATPEESASLYPSQSGGFFSHLAGLVTSPSFLLAASVVAPSILAAEAAGAAGAGAAGATGAGAAGATGAGAAGAAGAAPSAAATASPVITSPLAAPSVLAGDTLGASLSGLTAEQIAAATSTNALAPTTAGANAVNALAPVFDPASALETQLTATPGAAVTPVFDPASALETQLTATSTPAAVSPAAVTPVTTNALAPTFDPASALETQLTATPSVTGLPPGALDTLAKFAKDYGVPLASLISGITGSQAAQSAADTQARSAAEARDLARQIYEKQVLLQEPFRTAGITAQNQLLTLLGLPGGTQGAEFGRYARPFGMQDFQADPGYAFRLSEGMKALEASRAAKSGLLSGSAMKAAMRYGQEMGLQEYGNSFQRAQIERANRLQPLGSLAGMGQAAAAGQAGYAGQYGQTAGGLTTDIGAARAAGDVGAVNALTGALNTYLNYSANQNLVNALQDPALRRRSMYGPAIPV